MGLFPGLAICLLAGFNLLGDFLHDLLNPGLRDIGSG
jgi:ABC-type dipeptide/oligopeptide/nickel transport system permease subunit